MHYECLDPGLKNHPLGDMVKKWNMKAIEKTQLCEDESLPEDKKPSLEELKEWLGNK